MTMAEIVARLLLQIPLGKIDTVNANIHYLYISSVEIRKSSLSMQIEVLTLPRR